MKKVLHAISQIVENHYVNLFISIGLIAIGIEELYKEGVLDPKVHWKHGIGVYGILMLCQAIFKILKGSAKVYRGKKK